MKAITLVRWVAAPPASGLVGLSMALVAVLVPTVIRIALDGSVTGLPVTPFVPSVVLAAVFLGTRLAVGVSLASAIVGDALFVGPVNNALLESPTDIVAVAFFLTSSALIIGFVHAARRVIRHHHHIAATAVHPGGIVFSLEGGQAYASWYGQEGNVLLGPRDEVAEMMTDFVKQVELGKRLTGEA